VVPAEYAPLLHRGSAFDPAGRRALPAERRRIRGGNADAGALSTPSASSEGPRRRALGRRLPPDGASADAAAPIVAEQIDPNAEKA